MKKTKKLEKIINEVYPGTIILVRDCNLSKDIFNKYEINKVFLEKIYVDCTTKKGKLEKDTRYYIISNNCFDFSLFEDNTSYGWRIIKRNSCFKILYKATIDNKQIVILLHIPNKHAKILENVRINLDDDIIEKILGKHHICMKNCPIPELTEEWYRRLEIPLGIDIDGEFNSL